MLFRSLPAPSGLTARGWRPTCPRPLSDPAFGCEGNAPTYAQPNLLAARRSAVKHRLKLCLHFRPLLAANRLIRNKRLHPFSLILNIGHRPPDHNEGPPMPKTIVRQTHHPKLRRRVLVRYRSGSRLARAPLLQSYYRKLPVSPPTSGAVKPHTAARQRHVITTNMLPATASTAAV